MDIKKTISEKTLKISVEGSIDFVTSTDFEQAVMNDIDKVDKIIVDLAKVPYISSSALRVFMRAYQILSRPNSVVVLNANEEIKEVFDITRFSDMLEIK